VKVQNGGAVKASERTYPVDVRAAVVAAVVAGAGQADTARRYGLTRQLVCRWMKEARSPRVDRAPLLDPDVLGVKILELIDAHLESIQKQIEAASDPGWVRRQTGGELAQLLKEEHGGLVRLLAGLRPASEVVPEGVVVELGAAQAAGDGD
jgi:transposase-like protein